MLFYKRYTKQYRYNLVLQHLKTYLHVISIKNALQLITSLQGPQIRLQVKLVSQSNLWQGDSRPSESSMSRFLALVRSCLGLFHFVPTFLSSRFLTTLLLYSCVYFFLFVNLYCSYAQGILCEIHTSCMGSPLIVHAQLSLVFWLLRIMLCCVEND